MSSPTPNPIPDGAPSSTGRGGRGGRGGRWNNNLSNRNRHNNKYNKNSPRFTGREPLLQGHIYDSGDRNADQFIKTTKEIGIYVGTNQKNYVSIFVDAVENLELVDPIAPNDPDPTNVIELEKWKLAHKEYKEQSKAYSDFRASLYSVVFGQCTDALMDRLKSHIDFPAAKQDGIKLLKIIKSLIYTQDDNRKLVDVVTDLKSTFYSFKQGENMSLIRYYDLFTNQVSVLQEMGVSLSDASVVEAIAASNGRPGAATDDDVKAAVDQAMAVQFLKQANSTFRSYLIHLRNSFLDGIDFYPTNVHQAYNILQRRESESGGVPIIENEGIAFVNAGQKVPNNPTQFTANSTVSDMTTSSATTPSLSKLPKGPE